jgi:hypothetical protein
MDLQPYVEALQADLASAAAAGTAEAQSTASLLAVALEPAVRLCLLDALSAMAAEITDQTGSVQVELRMRGREPEVVVLAADPAAFAPPVEPPPAGASSSSASSDDEEDRGTARLTLRLPDQLKAGAEQRAAAEGLSLNAWLVRVVAGALRPGPFARPVPTHDRGRRITGFARG